MVRFNYTTTNAEFSIVAYSVSVIIIFKKIRIIDLTNKKVLKSFQTKKWLIQLVAKIRRTDIWERLDSHSLLGHC